MKNVTDLSGKTGAKSKTKTTSSKPKPKTSKPSSVPNGKSLSDVFNYIKNNKGMSAGLGITGLANMAGLVDNQYVGGQLGGLAAGGLGAKYLLPKLVENVSPQAKVLTTLGGGTLGSLFDMLMASRANEQNTYNGGNY